MRVGLRRASVAWVLVATLLVPAVGSHAEASKLERIRTERAALLERIEAHEAAAHTLQERVDAVNASMIELRNELTRLDRQIADIEAQVRSAQARIDATQKKMDRIERIASAQAVLLYKTGGTQALDALFNSGSLAELDSRIQFLSVAATESTGALIAFGRLQATIDAQHRELFARRSELNEVRLTQSAILAKMDEQHQKLAADLAELERTLGDEHRHEGDLAYAQAQLEGTLDALYAKQAAEARGFSAQGFIWPLNGAITSYYGPRWGRMHEGIDIDGYTGQPIVASQTGSVILAQYYSGYGNAVIVDHGGGFATLYAHMSAFAVSVGDEVARGDMVGKVGCTGSCTGDHLHFEVRIDGSPVDPLDYLP